jgi:Undecaprenyl-phosphate glucose phosphotransferase
MFRRYHRFFLSLQVMRDALFAGLAFTLAYTIRFHVMPGEHFSLARENVAVAVLAIATWPVVGWLGDLFVSHRTRSLTSEVFKVFQVSFVAFLVLVTVTYYVRDVRYSRVTLLLWAAFSFGLISTGRMASRLLLRSMRSRGYNLRHVIVVGEGDLAAHVLETIHRSSTLGVRAVGVVAADAQQAGTSVAGVPVLGAVGELGDVLRRVPCDQVIVALPVDQLGALRGIMQVLSQETVDVRLVPDVYQYATLCGSIEEFAGLPIINLQSTRLMGWNLVFKRAFDIGVAAAGLIVVAPVMLAIGALVKLSSNGPVFFTQERVGLDGRSFRMFKFRTMRADAEAAGARMTAPNDPRRTTLGTWLRRTSADELPQLWNVLRGDMSLVGPRPEQPAFIDNFKKEIPRYALRHKIKAGMTGWAQVNGMRGKTDIEKRIELDLYYIENWSLFLDVKILLRTLFGGFLSPNAY